MARVSRIPVGAARSRGRGHGDLRRRAEAFARAGDRNSPQFESDAFLNFFTMLARELDDDYFAVIDRHLKRLKFRDGVSGQRGAGKGTQGRGLRPAPAAQPWGTGSLAHSPSVPPVTGFIWLRGTRRARERCPTQGPRAWPRRRRPRQERRSHSAASFGCCKPNWRSTSAVSICMNACSNSARRSRFLRRPTRRPRFSARTCTTSASR